MSVATSESLIAALARGCRGLASRCVITGDLKVGAVSGRHLMSVCMPAVLGENGMYPSPQLPSGECGTTRGFSDLTKSSEQPNDQPEIAVAVRPFLSHACEAPAAVATTSASELMHMLTLMTTIRRSEIAADKVTR